MLRSFAIPMCAGLSLFAASVQVSAHPGHNHAAVDADGDGVHIFPYFVEAKGPITATLDATGEKLLFERRAVWKPFCVGPIPEDVTPEDLQVWAEIATDLQQGEQVVMDNTPIAARGAGFNIVFLLSPSVPPAAVPAIAEVEAYLEAQFGDPITVFMSINFFNFNNASVLGSASSSDLAVLYPQVRQALVDGMDPDDTLQDFLPIGTTIPVRYESQSAAITNENRVFVNTANFEATFGSVGGTDSSLNFNTQRNFDYNPANGVSGTDFQSVLVHEAVHGLGFLSLVDFDNNDITVLDLFRFPNSDFINGVNGDWNPDTLAEFTARPRFQDEDNGNTFVDDSEAAANSDLISVEYRMSDGFINGVEQQATHFDIGSIMDPTIASGTTFFPNFLGTPALDMLDVIGYDIPPSPPNIFATIGPLDGATGVSTEPLIEWNGSTGAVEYRIRIDDNSNFSSTLVDETLPGAATSYQVLPGVLNANTTYFYTVDATNGLGTTTISGSPIEFETGVFAPGTFDLLSPANFSVTSDTTPTLDWADSSNADEYRVELSTAGFFFPLLIDETFPASNGSEFTPAPGVLAPDTQYFWRVTASNPAGAQISNPASSRFTTGNDPVSICTADLDGDDDVDFDDFVILTGQFGSVPADCLN